MACGVGKGGNCGGGDCRRFSIALPPPGTSPAGAADRDCGDFSSEKQAQANFDDSLTGDPHNLDWDGDGRGVRGSARPVCRTRRRATAAASARSAHESLSATHGDTLKVRIRKRTRDLRLILGIDSPEVNGRGECGGSRATRAMRRLDRSRRPSQVISNPVRSTFVISTGVCCDTSREMDATSASGRSGTAGR